LSVSLVAGLEASGCSDGTREGFLQLKPETQFWVYPNIAGCKGAWTVPGISRFAPQNAPACPNLHPINTMNPHCDRKAGNNAVNTAGTGCAASDLCAVGWHICLDYKDVNVNTGNKGCQDCGVGVQGDFLFLSRQSSNGCGKCAEGTSVDPKVCNSQSCLSGCLQSEFISNDVFGCGNYGEKIEAGSGWDCAPFNRFSHDDCSAISAWQWSCTAPEAPGGLCETYLIKHSNPSNGGVLCCKDEECPDTDGDGVSDCVDNCVGTPNPDQKDCDHDGTGSACDPCPKDPTIDNSNYKGYCNNPKLERHSRLRLQP